MESKVEMTPFSITPGTHFGEFELPVPTLVSVGIEVLIPRAVTLSTDDTVKVLLSFNVQLLLPGHFSVFVTRDQQTRKGISIQTELFNLIDQ